MKFVQLVIKNRSNDMFIDISESNKQNITHWTPYSQRKLLA